jgi:hypothetical protein
VLILSPIVFAVDDDRNFRLSFRAGSPEAVPTGHHYEQGVTLGKSSTGMARRRDHALLPHLASGIHGCGSRRLAGGWAAFFCTLPKMVIGELG